MAEQQQFDYSGEHNLPGSGAKEAPKKVEGDVTVDIEPMQQTPEEVAVATEVPEIEPMQETVAEAEPVAEEAIPEEMPQRTYRAMSRDMFIDHSKDKPVAEEPETVTEEADVSEPVAEEPVEVPEDVPETIPEESFVESEIPEEKPAREPLKEIPLATRKEPPKTVEHHPVSKKPVPPSAPAVEAVSAPQTEEEVAPKKAKAKSGGDLKEILKMVVARFQEVYEKQFTNKRR